MPGERSPIASTAETGTVVPDPRARLVFAAVLCLWLALPVLRGDHVAQDALPLYVAGDLVATQPDDLYIDVDDALHDPPAAFAARLCELVPAGTSCADVQVAYVSTPLSLGPLRALSLLPDGAAVVLLRVLASGALVAGMALLWQRLAHSVPGASSALAISAVLLTPMATIPVDLGQTAPLLFLCALLPPSDERRGWGREALWVLVTALKGFTAIAGVLLIAQRQRIAIARSAVLVALLAGVALLLAPTSLIGDFLRSAGELSADAATDPYGGSLDAALVDGFGVAASTATAVGWVARVGVLIAAPLVLARLADREVRWSLALLAALLVLPQVWWHYLWLAVAAIGVALAAPGAPRRALPALPIAAGVLGAVSIPYAAGQTWPLLQLTVLVAAVATATTIARMGADRSRDTPLEVGT